MVELHKDQESTPERSQEITSAYRERIASEYADGYPTEETLAEFLEAHKSGGKDGIKALLEKRRAALAQAKEPKSDASCNRCAQNFSGEKR